MRHQVMLKVIEQNGKYTFAPDSNLWRQDSTLPAGGKFVFNKNDHGGMKEDECHYIHFKLHPTENAGLRFPSLEKDAMWVIRPRPGHDCPDAGDVSAGNIDYSVMGPHSRDSDTQLTAYNRNKDIEQWSFSLNFVKPGGQDGDIARFRGQSLT